MKNIFIYTGSSLYVRYIHLNKSGKQLVRPMGFPINNKTANRAIFDNGMGMEGLPFNENLHFQYI